MSDLLPYVLVLHTILILVLAVMVFGLTRQIGILHERVAPMGAMTNDHGIAFYEGYNREIKAIFFYGICYK